MANEQQKAQQGQVQKPSSAPNTNEELVMVSKSELTKMIEDAALKILETRLAQTGNVGFDMSQLGEVIGNAVADGMRKNTRPKVTIGEYLRRGYSVFHPNGAKGMKHLTRQCFNNGALIQEATVHDTEIELLNRITHSGRYIGRNVNVWIEQTGSEDVVHVAFNNKPDGLSAIRDLVNPLGCKSFFEAMLKQIVAEQEEEDKEATIQEEMAREQRKAFLARKAAKESVQATEA